MILLNLRFFKNFLYFLSLNETFLAFFLNLIFFLLIVIALILTIEVLNSRKIAELQAKKPEVKLSNAEKKKMEAMKASFNNLMEYDEDVAMKRK